MSPRYKEYWNDRFGALPLSLAFPISVLLAFRFNAVHLLAIHLSPLRSLVDSTFVPLITSILSGLVYFLCVLAGVIELTEWHDRRVYETRFTKEERERLKNASDMAHDYWPREATEAATKERDRLRTERYQYDQLELHLRKGFTPLDSKNMNAEAVRQKRQQIAQELYQRFYPKDELNSIKAEPSKGVSVQTALLLKKALALVHNDEELNRLMARMKELST